MSDKNHAAKNVTGRWLEIDEVRLVSDLRIMHAKVDELYLLVQNLKRRHDEAAVYNYADHLLLQEDIDRCFFRKTLTASTRSISGSWL